MKNEYTSRTSRVVIKFPMHTLSDDPNDLTVLAPSHLLIRVPLLAILEPSLIREKKNSLPR